MTRRPQSPALFKRAKRAWAVMDQVERLGWILVVGHIPLRLITLLVKSWNLEASRHARAARLASTPLDPVLEAVDWIGMAMPLLCLMAIMIGLRRFNARLRRERFAFCPGCEYDLTATRRAAHCPECGRAFGPKGYIREWGRIYPRRGRRWGEPMAIVRHPEGSQ